MLPMSQQDDPDNGFCYIDIRQYKDLYIVCFNIMVQVVLIAVVIKGYLLSRLTDQRPKFIIFYAMFIWGAIYLLEYVFAIFIFFFSALKDINDGNRKLDDNQIIYSLVLFSKLYYFIDSIPAFIIQGMFIYIPFNILGNLFQYLVQRKSMLPALQHYFYKFVKWYQWGRLVIFIPNIFVLVYPYESTKQLRYSANAGLVLTMLDALICNIILVQTQRIFFRKQIFLQKMINKDRQKLKKQLLFLNISCVFRILVDGLYFIYVNQFVHDQKQCPIYSPYNSWIYLLGGQITMHLIPILTMIKMNMPEYDADSLLNEDQSSEQNKNVNTFTNF